MKKIIFCAISLLACVEAGRAQTIAAWNFENDSNTNDVNGNPSDNNPAPSTTDPYGTASADAIGMGIYPTPNDGINADDITLGKSSDTGSNGVSDKTNVWRIRAQGPSTAAANGWSSSAPIGTQGAQFFAPTTGVTSSQFSGVTVTFDWYSTTQGEANLALEYTTDGTTWTDIPVTLGGSDTGLKVLSNTSDPNLITGSYLNDTTNNTSGGQDWFTGLTATITNPAVLNDPNFGIEMVNAATGTTDDVSTQNTALNNTSGNWRFDNVSITLDAAPEPSTWAMLIGGVGALALVSRLRRLSA